MSVAVSTVAERPRFPSTNSETRELVMRMYQRCDWYELALMRHGFTVDRLQKLARKIASDELRIRNAVLGDRFEDLVSRLQIVGLQAAVRYNPEHTQTLYGKNGGEPFASYVADVMGKRVDDFFRSKAEGFGDRRYGHDGRLELTDEVEEVDPDVAFNTTMGKRISLTMVARWQRASEISGWDLDEWIKIALNAAADGWLEGVA